MYRTIRLWGLSTCKGTHFWRQRMHIAPTFYTIGTLFRSNRESGREMAGCRCTIHPTLSLPIAHCGAMPGEACCIGLRSVLHEPSQRTALSVPASPAYPRSGTSPPEEPTSLPRQPHYESQEAAPALPAQNASRGETASCVPFPLAPDAAGQSRSAWQEISSPCAP